MSNEIYGYIKSNEMGRDSFLLSKMQEKSGLGFTQISLSELYNFPDEFMPPDDDRYLSFLVGDKPGKNNATYLIDCLDYAQESDIGLPKKGRERLELLVKSFMTMIHMVHPERFVIALTDSSEIEFVKKVKFSNLLKTIISDCDMQCPPDCLYDIVVDE